LRFDESTISFGVGGDNIENIIGEERRNTYGTSMRIISARNKSDIDVQFLDEHGYIKRHAMYINFVKGQIKNPYDKNKYGVEICDIPDIAECKLENQKKVISWRRIARAVEKNDFYLKRLSFAQTKTEENELRKLVPSYMIPRKIKILDAFPLNTNGKIDRKRLMEEI